MLVLQDVKVLLNRNSIQLLSHVQLVNVQCVQSAREHLTRMNL